MMQVGDTPLTSAQYSTLETPSAVSVIGGVYQLPFALTTLSVFYNQAQPASTAKASGYQLQLDACTLAKIYNGNITM